MKQKLTIISISGIIAAFSVGPLSVAYAIEPPPDDAQPPAALNQPQGVELNAEHQDKPVPFVGIATASLPDMVADHLDIESGSGVIIRTVYPGSPAEKAGLSVNDIILTIDGSAVGRPEVISSLMRQHKVGDRLSLEIIHKGKPAKVEVVIGERPADLVAQLNQEPLLEGVPQQHADRLRGLLEQNRKAFGHGGVPGGMFPDAHFEEAFRSMRERMNQAMESAPQFERNGSGGIQLQQSSTIRMMDNEGTIEIKSGGENTEVTVRDVDNEIVWIGPWDTDQDKAAAPQGIRKRIDKVNSGAGRGFRFRFGGLKPVPKTTDN